jgi:hypothetical protein
MFVAVESFYLCPNNEYFGEGNSQFYLFCKNVFTLGKSPARVHPEILDIVGELSAVYMDRLIGGGDISPLVGNVMWTQLDFLASILFSTSFGM